MKTILLVEGPMPVRELSGSLFRRRECVLDVASSGEEALAHLAENPADVVIFDCGVPDMDAATFTRSLMASQPHVPVIALLERTENDEEDELREAGAAAVLVRPIHDIDLNQAIRDVLGIQLRRHVRTFVKLRVDATAGEKTQFATIRDISLGGVRLESETALEVGNVIKLAFFLPDDEVPVTALAHVVRQVGGDTTTYGCEFLGLDVNDRERIHDFVSVVEVAE